MYRPPERAPTPSYHGPEIRGKRAPGHDAWTPYAEPSGRPRDDACPDTGSCPGSTPNRQAIAFTPECDRRPAMNKVQVTGNPARPREGLRLPLRAVYRTVRVHGPRATGLRLRTRCK